uniref:Dynein axonemal assembly factor 3 n=1 Tax=Salarias fasciatus TaxID=181472 RepID=A0A672JUJ1_SALFA
MLTIWPSVLHCCSSYYHIIIRRHRFGFHDISWKLSHKFTQTNREVDANVLLVGSGDPRHILKTIAGFSIVPSLQVWVVENSMEVVARQLLLLYLALMPQENMGINEKTEIFLEVFGNGEIRSQTEETVRRAACQLSRSVTEAVETAAHDCLNTSLLKVHTSLQCHRAPFSMSRAWDYRVRQHLGTRYDSRKGCFDWDLTMKLHGKGCGVISKQQYVRWRERGLAFEMREGVYQTANASLLSSKVFSQRGRKVSVRGYWGDIVSSPYLSFGIETDDQSLLKTHNGQHIKTDCSTRRRARGGAGQVRVFIVTGLVTMVTVLPLRVQYCIWFSVLVICVSQNRGLPITLFLKVVVVPTVFVFVCLRYILDLNKEQEDGFAETVRRMASEAAFEPWHEENREDAHAVFIQQEK